MGNVLDPRAVPLPSHATSDPGHPTHSNGVCETHKVPRVLQFPSLNLLVSLSLTVPSPLPRSLGVCLYPWECLPFSVHSLFLKSLPTPGCLGTGRERKSGPDSTEVDRESVLLRGGGSRTSISGRRWEVWPGRETQKWVPRYLCLRDMDTRSETEVRQSE